MSDMTVSNDPFRHVYPYILPESSVYHTAAKIAATRPPAQEQGINPNTKGRFYLNTSQINALLTRFRMKTLTLEELQNFPLSRLNPNEREFIWFLQRNPHIFQRLAGLDHHPESLSVEDLKIAAQLAGDALILSEEDLHYLDTQPMPVVPPKAPSSLPRPEQKVPSQEILPLFHKLVSDRNGMTYDALMHLKPQELPLTSIEQDTLRFLQSKASQKVLYNLSKPYQGQITDRLLQVFISLIGNPAVLGSVPIVFMQEPQDEDLEEEVEAPESSIAIPKIGAKVASQQPFRLRQKIEWRVSALKALLHHISPDEHVTFRQLMDYVPQNTEEAQMLTVLKQSGVFQTLAGQDREPDTLSVDDIRVTVMQGALLLQDPYMMLVLLP